eukprot:2722949-Pyramimonas_sp.AAC.1
MERFGGPRGFLGPALEHIGGASSAAPSALRAALREHPNLDRRSDCEGADMDTFVARDGGGRTRRTRGRRGRG